MEEKKGFFASLFDFSFSKFITIKIIKILYGIAIITAAIAALFFIVSGFRASIAYGILFILLSPMVFIIYVILARVWLEMVIVLFRIAENTQKMVEKK